MTNTPRAQQALQMAHAYLEKLYATKNPSPDQVINHLKLAAHHLTLARAADPFATLVVNEKQGPQTYTQEVLAARVLHLQAAHESALEDEAGCLKALETLKKASAYMPRAPLIHRSIAEVLLKLHRREEAIVAAEFAVALDPSDVDSRMLLDKITTIPSIGVKEVLPGSTERSIGLAMMLASPVLFFVVPNFLAKVDAGNGAIVLGMAAPVLLFYLGYKLREWGEGTTYLHNQTRKDRYR